MAILGLVAAGAVAPDEMQALGVSRIPLLKVQGETLLARACRCLIEGAGCREVVVVAPQEVPLPEIPAGLDAQILRGEYTGEVIENLLSALSQRLVAGSQIDGAIVSSADMPLLSPEAIAALLAAQRQSQADVVYPAVEKSVVQQRFPEARCTFYRLGKISVTGGNAVYLNPAWLLSHERTLRDLFALRKDPAGMARFFGPLFLMKVLAGSASVEQVEEVVGQKLGGRLKAAVLPFAEIGVDLDKAADLELFRPYLDKWA
ncbi:nucleotidyltransferase family protein [bacterium]|nr:nucleotidyltransferase family protein [bacterium]